MLNIHKIRKGDKVSVIYYPLGGTKDFIVTRVTKDSISIENGFEFSRETGETLSKNSKIVAHFPKSNPIVSIVQDIIGFCVIASLGMVMLEALFFVDGIAQYTDILVWVTASFVFYALTQMNWEG